MTQPSPTPASNAAPGHSPRDMVRTGGEVPLASQRFGVQAPAAPRPEVPLPGPPAAGGGQPSPQGAPQGQNGQRQGESLGLQPDGSYAIMEAGQRRVVPAAEATRLLELGVQHQQIAPHLEQLRSRAEFAEHIETFLNGDPTGGRRQDMAAMVMAWQAGQRYQPQARQVAAGPDDQGDPDDGEPVPAYVKELREQNRQLLAQVQGMNQQVSARFSAQDKENLRNSARARLSEYPQLTGRALETTVDRVLELHQRNPRDPVDTLIRTAANETLELVRDIQQSTLQRTEAYPRTPILGGNEGYPAVHPTTPTGTGRQALESGETAKSATDAILAFMRGQAAGR